MKKNSALKISKLLVLGLFSAWTTGAIPNTEKQWDPNFKVLDKSSNDYAQYEKHCASCHETSATKAPPIAMLQFMSASTIYRALTTGVMVEQSAALTKNQKKQLAEFITNTEIRDKATSSKIPMCKTKEFDKEERPNAQSWGITYGNTRNIPPGAAEINASNLQTLELDWAFAFPDAQRARSHPLIAGGVLFTGSQNGTVYALDAATGCMLWSFEARAEVRTGIVISPWDEKNKLNPQIFFGDLVGNIYAMDAITGGLNWQIHPEGHPAATITGTPTLYEGILYAPISSLEVVSAVDENYECCTFQGSVVAIDVRDGSILWKQKTIEKPPSQTGRNSAGTINHGPSGAPIWNSPAIDIKRNQIYVGTGENYSSPATKTSDAILALDLKTGEIKWVYQATIGDAWNSSCGSKTNANCPVENGPDFDFGASIVLAKATNGKDYVIGPQKSGVVHAINPDSGKLIWKRKLGRGGLHGGIHFGVAVADDKVFVPISDAPDNRSYTDSPSPGLFALDLSTGAQIWRAPMVDECRGRQFCAVGIAAAITATNNLIFAGGLDGYLRIHDASTGKLLKKIDTTIPVESISGVIATGGSMDGAAAPLPHGSFLYVNSGYNFASHMPGNALLVYKIVSREKSIPRSNKP